MGCMSQKSCSHSFQVFFWNAILGGHALFSDSVAQFAGGPAGVSAVVALRSQGRPWAEFGVPPETMVDGDDTFYHI